jgi:hypothetical protein
MKRYSILVTLFVLPILIYSCIFQSDMLAPNNPPVLQFYEPQESYIDGFIITHSLVFRISATDPDHDLVEYSFNVNDIEISESDTLLFHPLEKGEYRVVGFARDAHSFVQREWIVNVLEKPNSPPIITSFEPAQQNIACVLGDALHFSFVVSDDNPEFLRYSYELDGEILAQYLKSSDYDIRFFENGQHVLDGIVNDGQYWDTISWFVSVEGFPDTICPSAIDDLAGAPGETWGSIYLTWTAPGDDSTWGSAASYHVRTSVYPIITETDWQKAEGKTGEPVPSPAGTTEEMAVIGLNPGTYIWVTVRAQDDFFNWSPLGNSVPVLVRGADFEGYVRDACSGGPLEGFIVSASGHSAISDQDGGYVIDNLPGYSTTLRCQDEMIIGEIGEYYDTYQYVAMTALHNYFDFIIIPALELVDTVTDRYSSFISFLRDITSISESSVLKSWNHYPLRVYSPPYVYEGVDLQAAALGAMNEWEGMTGYDLFVIEENPDAADIQIVYIELIQSFHSVKTLSVNPDGTPKLMQMSIYVDYSVIPIDGNTHLIFAHEFGHTLCLGHSRDPGHLMLGYGSLPDVDHVTTDEANAVKVIYNLPPIYDLANVLVE